MRVDTVVKTKDGHVRVETIEEGEARGEAKQRSFSPIKVRTAEPQVG